MQRKGNPLILLVGMHSGAVWRIVWKLLKKLKIELSFDLATPLLGIYPEKTVIQKGSVQFSLFITSNSLGPHGLQHARHPCLSLSPRVCSNYVCCVGDAIQPSHLYCRFFSICLQSFSASPSGSFPVSLLFTSGGQSIGISASASVLPVNIQG